MARETSDGDGKRKDPRKPTVEHDPRLWYGSAHPLAWNFQTRYPWNRCHKPERICLTQFFLAMGGIVLATKSRRSPLIFVVTTIEKSQLWTIRKWPLTLRHSPFSLQDHQAFAFLMELGLDLPRVHMSDCGKRIVTYTSGKIVHFMLGGCPFATIRMLTRLNSSTRVAKVVFRTSNFLFWMLLERTLNAVGTKIQTPPKVNVDMNSMFVPSTMSSNNFL